MRMFMLFPLLRRAARAKLGLPCLFAIASLVSGCAPPEPIRLGFLGGISGRVADLGVGGRNGAALAIDLRNQAGGINGRKVVLIVEDDQQNPEVAKQAVTRLITQKVAAIIGPMTSAMAVATVPLVNEAKLLMLSPTVTTTALSGLDDYFLRIIEPTTAYARKAALYHFNNQGSRRIAAAYDQRNLAYTESWLTDYRRVFETAGGAVLKTVAFSSNETTQFGELADRLLEVQPDSVLIVANSVDTALLAQQLRKRSASVHINTSEWAATERLIELGGKAVEGMVIAQFIDRDSTQPAYLAFHKAYLARFGQEPGFAGLSAFDATNVVLDALLGQKEGQSLKHLILTRREFAGAQAPIRFDANGDATREVYQTIIRNGAFVRLRCNTTASCE
ncbi:MAG: ABC transporter substrate-binding protein [Gammaproteobacteria bacterium]|nr:amino acid ABC transporter substrate-binding protein [Rhodoferax sp.]MBU3898367.1 ABC transporter substrate-binding protein [Gammaproteobacteria bacterium]MBU3998086.1 ABC transporter substrate-binding protein [Gammaproteobacteria bacterium]MBU4019608.1 ABC transporter substrate-binding protein [Gammaproteobacteria bacterium]MBU4079141.1 ABC transporter substrate-binding protein [Gammaproteobacteria bacterium]